MNEWRLGVSLAIVAMILAIALFSADKLISDEDFSEGVRDALSVAGQVAPWIAGGALAVVVGLITRAAGRNLASRWGTMQGRQRIAEERARQLEIELKEAREALQAATAEPAQAAAKPAQTAAKPERREWASTSLGVTRLAVPNSELEDMYERAMALLNGHDSEHLLTWFHVMVHPYRDPPNQVSITFTLYSYRTGREYSSWLTDDSTFHGDRIGRRTLGLPKTLHTPPWREQPDWCEIFNLAAQDAGPLIGDPDTTLAIMAGPPSPPLKWSLYIEDYGTKRRLDFSASSSADVRRGIM